MTEPPAEEPPAEERPKCRCCDNPCAYYQPTRGRKRLRAYCSSDCADTWKTKRKRELERSRRRSRSKYPRREISEADKQRVREMALAAQGPKPDRLTQQKAKLYEPGRRQRENDKKMQIAAARRREDKEAGRFAYTLIQDRRYPGDIRYALAIEPVRITQVEIPEVLKWKGIVLSAFGAGAFARMVNQAGRLPKCGGRFPSKEFGGDRNGGANGDREPGGRVYVPTNKERRAFGLPEIDLANPAAPQTHRHEYWMGTTV